MLLTSAQYLPLSDNSGALGVGVVVGDARVAGVTGVSNISSGTSKKLPIQPY